MFRNSGWLDGANGLSLLSVVFYTDDDQANFESLAGVDPLPTTGTISGDQAAAITAIGLPVTSSKTLADVRALARTQYLGML
ncbi:MAG TPA: hypothetical protein VHV29_06985 [Terriglobales bacterium]|jgi:hypothetical protein|nr:hypothetical protein [Terriglobales bacterium]